MKVSSDGVRLACSIVNWQQQQQPVADYLLVLAAVPAA
jgi:hypothetical protein